MKATDKKKSAKEPVRETEVESEVGWKYFWNDSEIDEGTHNKLTEEHRLWVIAEEKKSEAIQVATAAAAKKNSEDKNSKKRKSSVAARK